MATVSVTSSAWSVTGESMSCMVAIVVVVWINSSCQQHPHPTLPPSRVPLFGYTMAQHCAAASYDVYRRCPFKQ
uniref:Uncharacterized protein n=1 Tax=Arion vulgaris TaxID=1028688 RepID=A0A0B6Z775_9EUPU